MSVRRTAIATRTDSHIVVQSGWMFWGYPIVTPARAHLEPQQDSNNRLDAPRGAHSDESPMIVSCAWVQSSIDPKKPRETRTQVVG